ncbi:hypothetical protein [Chryseobacterium sp. RLHN22]|uniref:hypothetical protein n=1 Tax=Chryseobacterium sp. RLHN22 TaxID=3437885 RepID=UPI003D9B1238
MINHSLIQRFLNAPESFSKSLNISTYEYDVTSLRKILHLRELKEITGVDDKMIDFIDSLDFELGKLLPGIIQGHNLYSEYLAIERKILDTVDGVLYIYAKQSALSVLSLILYKRNEFEQAIKITQECIILNEFLVNKGMFTMNVRIYEQIKNITKIYHRAGQDQKGFQLAADLFKYLYSGKPTSVNFYSTIINNAELYKKTPILRETYTNDVFLIYLQEYMRFKNPSFTELDWIENLDFEVFSEDRKFIFNWIYITKLFYKKNYDEYLECLEFFLDDDVTTYYDLLKVNLLLHFKNFIGQSDISKQNKELIADNIEYYFKNNIGLNKNILQNILNESYNPA